MTLDELGWQIYCDETQHSSCAKDHWHELAVPVRNILRDKARTQLLNKLNRVLMDATECGLLDEITSETKNPDIVNQFCDAVEELRLPPKKKFRVDLATLARMRGSLEVTAKDKEEAESIAMDKSGDVLWKYEGACTGEDGPSVESVVEIK